MQQSLFALAVQNNEPQAPANPLAQTLNEAVFTVIDLETTGLNAKKSAITEVTAIQFKNGEEVAKFSTLVNPMMPIPDEVVAITGITDDMVANAPSLLNVMTDLCRFVGNAPLVVGHNVGFDIKFIVEKLEASSLGSFIPRFDLARAFCTKTLAVKAMPGLPSYEGIVVATQCGVVNPNPHRAEADVRMSAGILFALIDRLRRQGVKLDTVQDLMDYQGSLANPTN